MIKLDNILLKICLLDTCVISDFFEDETLYFNFLQLMHNEKLLIAISISTINELMRISEKYERFKNDFTKIHSYLTKPSQMLLEDELNSYPNHNESKYLFRYLYNDKDLLEHFKQSQKFQTSRIYLDNNKKIVLDSIHNLKDNFPPDKNGKYSIKRIQDFVETVIFQQLSTFYPDWMKTQLSTKKDIDTNIFKSLKAQILIAFWKFYLLKDRKNRESDIFDITIVSALPYVDMFITENNMRNDINQIKKKGLLFENLEVLSIKDLRTASH